MANTNAARRISGHPLVGQVRVYRQDAPPYDAGADTSPGQLIIANGMTVEVCSVFWNWNEVPGLDMAYVYVKDTGEHAHVTPSDIGYTDSLLGSE